MPHPSLDLALPARTPAPARRHAGGFLLLLALLAATFARGQVTLYWDVNGAVPGTGTSPSGVWSAGSDADWSTDATGSVATSAWVSGDNAVFSAGTNGTGNYTVTVVGKPSVSNLSIEEGNPTFAGSGSLNFVSRAPTITTATGTTATFNVQLLSTSAGLTFNGSGTSVLGNNTNSYSGPTAINGGLVQFSTANALPVATALTIGAAGTLDLGYGNSAIIGSLSGSGALNIRNNSFTVGDTTNTTFSGVISDGGGYGTIVKQGSGTLTLSGANTFNGPVTVLAGALNVQNSAALGTSGYGNSVASGAALQLQGGISVVEGNISIAGSGPDGTGALRNISGDNSFSGAVLLAGNATVGSSSGGFTLSGDVNLGKSQTLTTTGAGNIYLNGSVYGSQSGLSAHETGNLTLGGSASNSFTGTLMIYGGANVQLNKSGGADATGGGPIVIGEGGGATTTAKLTLLGSDQIPDYTSLVTINSNGRLNLNNQHEAFNTIAGTGVIDLATSGYLKLGGSSGTSVFGGSVTGAGTLEKAGSGSLTFTSGINFTGTLLLSGGTLALNGINSVGTLHITGNSILDFGNSTATTLNATNFIIDAGVQLTITNWASSTDYFYAQNWNGAVYNTSGTTPENQVTFTGFSSNATLWSSYDNQVRPNVPEPGTYGACLTACALLALGWRQRSRRPSASPAVPAGR